jgi:homoaconitase
LQKQGILPLWFADKSDYSKISAGDSLETHGLEALLTGVNDSSIIVLKLTKLNGEYFEIPTKHTLSADQLAWLRAGSALNHIRAQLDA